MKKNEKSNAVENIPEGYERVNAKFPPAIRLEVGQAFVGTLVSRHSQFIKKYKKDSMIYTVVDENGEEFALWGSGLLDYQMKNLKDGDKFGVIYKGKVATKGYKMPLHQYDLLAPKKKK